MVSVRHIRADILVFARGYTRSRVGLFFSLAFPVILILMFGAIFSGGNSGPLNVYVQNQDGSGPAGAAFVTALNSTGVFKVITVSVSENLSEYLLSNSASDGIVIPAGFTSAYVSGEPINVTIYGDPASSTSEIVSGVAREVVNAFNLERAHGAPIIGVKQLKIVSQAYQYIDFLIPGMVGFSVLVAPMFSMVNVCSQYKRDKIFKQLSLTPLTRTEWLISKILFYILLSFASFLLLSLFGILVFGAHINFTVWVIPFLLVGPFLFVSLGMLVGTVSTSVESASVVGNLVMFPMMFLSGTFFPVNIMPTYLQNIAHVLPLFYVIEGLKNVMIYGNYSSALVDLSVIVIVSAIIFTLAVRFFKWRED